MIFILFNIKEKLIIEIPEPTGKYNIGTRSQHLIDLNREEIATQERNDFRELMVQIWYPSNLKGFQYLKINIPASDNLFEDLLARNVLQYSNSFEDLPVSTDRKFPLIIFSHGIFKGYRFQSTFLTEELASHGFIIVSIDHTYYSRNVSFSNRKIISRFDSNIKYDNKEEGWHAVIDIWSKDINYVVETILNFNDTRGHFLYQKIDHKNVAAIGHSFGGAAALMASITNEKIKVAINYDGTVDGKITKYGLSKPTLYFARESIDKKDLLGINKLTYNSTEMNVLFVNGIKHKSFVDISVLKPSWLRYYLVSSDHLESVNNIKLIRKITINYLQGYMLNESNKWKEFKSDLLKRGIARDLTNIYNNDNNLSLTF